MTPRPGDLVIGRQGARMLGRRLPCSIGRGGIVTDKREGDGGTPAGAHRLLWVWRRPDRVWSPGARDLRLGHIWSDDVGDPDYNLPGVAPSCFRHERLWRADPMYDLIGVLDWNQPPMPGRGSAIFLHVWRGPRRTTEGCVAFRRDDLAWILAQWRADSRVVVQP